MVSLKPLLRRFQRNCSAGPNDCEFRQNKKNILILSAHPNTHTHTHTHKIKESNFVCLDSVEFTLSLDENINVNIM